MGIPILHIDAFTSEPFKGNPAAVCLIDETWPAEWMQNVAAEMNLSETAFVVPRQDEGFDLRWFTPSIEVPLCGHATLASAHALWETGRLARDKAARFYTLSGWLVATRDGERIEMDFPALFADKADLPKALEQALKVKPLAVAANGHIVTMMKFTISIRAATAADAEMLTELAWRTFHDAFAPMNSPENMEAYMSQNFTQKKFSAQIADPGAVFLIAEIGATPVAFAKLYDGDAPDCVSGNAPIEIERFYVDRQFHGKGVAQTLMQACFDRARQSGHETVYLGVWEKNHRAIAFYRKCGFDVVGSHVFQMGDDAQNDLLMERMLQEPAR